MPDLEPVVVIIRGPHNSGRTTLANFLKMFFDENGYRDVKVEDTEPLPNEEKDPWPQRAARNRDLRPVRVRVELADESERDHEREACAKLVESWADEQQRDTLRSMMTLQQKEEIYRGVAILRNVAHAIRARGR